MKKIFFSIIFSALLAGCLPVLTIAQEVLDDSGGYVYGTGEVADPGFSGYGVVNESSDYVYGTGEVNDPGYYGGGSDGWGGYVYGTGEVSDPGFSNYGEVNDPSGYVYGTGEVNDPTYYGNEYADPYSGYGYGNSSYPYGSTYSPSPLNNDYCYNCISGRSSAYGVGGTQNYGGGYGNGWGVMYSNYGYAPVYGYGGTQYAAVAYPMYQYPQHYRQPVYYTQPTHNHGYNYTLSWGNISMGPVLYSKSIGTSVPLYGTYPSCTIYFLPGDTDYMRGLKWSGINISQAMLSGYGQVTGEGFMQVPYNGSAYMLTVWNSKGEMATCSTR